MNEAQLGLLLITPMLLVFIVFMYRQGAMPLAGAVAAALMSITIAVMLFSTQ